MGWLRLVIREITYLFPDGLQHYASYKPYVVSTSFAVDLKEALEE